MKKQILLGVVSLLVVGLIVVGRELYLVNKKLDASTMTVTLLQGQLNEMLRAEAEAKTQAQNQKPTPIPKTISVGDADNGKMVTLMVGQKLSVTVTEVGSDGGFQFQSPGYDTSLLHLDSHIMVPPPDIYTGVVGSSPTGIWTFTALRSGATSLGIVTARSFDSASGNALKYGISVLIK